MKNFLKTERIGPEVSQSVNQSVEVSQQYRRKAMNCVQVFSLACLLIQVSNQISNLYLGTNVGSCSMESSPAVKK